MEFLSCTHQGRRAAVYTRALLIISRRDWNTPPTVQLGVWRVRYVETMARQHTMITVYIIITRKNTFLFLNEYLQVYTSAWYVRRHYAYWSTYKLLSANIHEDKQIHYLHVHTFYPRFNMYTYNAVCLSLYYKLKIKERLGCPATHSVSACVVKQLLITFCKLDYVQTLT